MKAFHSSLFKMTINAEQCCFSFGKKNPKPKPTKKANTQTECLILLASILNTQGKIWSTR